MPLLACAFSRLMPEVTAGEGLGGRVGEVDLANEVDLVEKEEDQTGENQSLK